MFVVVSTPLFHRLNGNRILALTFALTFICNALIPVATQSATCSNDWYDRIGTWDAGSWRKLDIACPVPASMDQPKFLMVWIAVALYGFSMGASFPSTMTLVEETVTINGAITTFMIVGTATGEMSLPELAGTAMQELGDWSFGIVKLFILGTIFFVKRKCIQEPASIQAVGV